MQKLIVGTAAVWILTTPILALAQGPDDQWNAGNPPKEWPKFTIVPGKKAPAKRTDGQVLAYAQQVEQRWLDFVSGKSKNRITIQDSGNAIEELMTIKPTSLRFPEAWALFVRLRKIDKEVAHRFGND